MKDAKIFEAYEEYRQVNPDADKISFIAGCLFSRNESRLVEAITLKEYLDRRHATTISLTAAEAFLLGIPYPLQSGWVDRYVDLVIEEDLLNRLVTAREMRRDMNAMPKIRRRRK